MEALGHLIEAMPVRAVDPGGGVRPVFVQIGFAPEEEFASAKQGQGERSGIHGQGAVAGPAHMGGPDIPFLETETGRTHAHEQGGVEIGSAHDTIFLIPAFGQLLPLGGPLAQMMAGGGHDFGGHSGQGEPQLHHLHGQDGIGGQIPDRGLLSDQAGIQDLQLPDKLHALLFVLADGHHPGDQALMGVGGVVILGQTDPLVRHPGQAPGLVGQAVHGLPFQVGGETDHLELAEELHPSAADHETGAARPGLGLDRHDAGEGGLVQVPRDPLGVQGVIKVDGRVRVGQGLPPVDQMGQVVLPGDQHHADPAVLHIDGVQRGSHDG